MNSVFSRISRNTLMRLSFSVGFILLLSACATNPQALRKDPFESTNRHVFALNEGLDEKVLKPGAKIYDVLVPSPVQTAIDNFTNNIKDVWSLTNLILQGQGVSAIHELMRIGINTTLGFAGFVDVATDLRLDRHNEDFGQTLAVWGVENGPYLVLPIFGPSTARDAAALPFDQYAMPVNLFDEVRDINAVRTIQLLNTRAKFLQAGDLISDAALDKYAFVRDAYLQRRRNMIYNGEPPDDETFEDARVAPSQNGTFFTTVATLPNDLSKHMKIKINTSIFFDIHDQNAQDQTQYSTTVIAHEIDLPTLPNKMNWEIVSTH